MAKRYKIKHRIYFGNNTFPWITVTLKIPVSILDMFLLLIFTAAISAQNISCKSKTTLRYRIVASWWIKVRRHFVSACMGKVVHTCSRSFSSSMLKTSSCLAFSACSQQSECTESNRHVHKHEDDFAPYAPRTVVVEYIALAKVPLKRSHTGLNYCLQFAVNCRHPHLSHSGCTPVFNEPLYFRVN